ncbi:MULTISPECIES: PaaX family transcriptional regulator [Actinokineospora]|uniref:PaaX family transcriptional regulator n=1 Tax=Actinokineospora fastidiosa TaxID=1816 RepID=A0A918LJZ2_9PSEU|nr:MULTISPECIES: PaaX family transcriptional regulator C-terminal domain-containing protein [Actinokineospora]UVS78356.1 Transcriptional repressor PaaX [Actinokineospora sp. UTMC 2448]GGS59265.1 PaaX family transcriptional regulator [Actinokineospora fastidiosa]
MSDSAPQDLVLTILGAHLRPRESAAVWSGGLVTLLGGFGYTAGASRVALNRLVGGGLLARAREGRLVHYTLTQRAVDVLAEGDERIFGLGAERPGPVAWTVLWHSIPEERRDARSRLVRRLRFLGFGQVQDGAWLAAHDRAAQVTRLCADLGVERHAGVLVGAPVPGFADFARRVWDLDALAARYRAFVTDFADIRADSDAAAFHLRVRLVHAFRQFALLDPELPADIVAPPPDRAAAVRLFHDRYPALEAPARRHFDGVMTP